MLVIGLLVPICTHLLCYVRETRFRLLALSSRPSRPHCSAQITSYSRLACFCMATHLLNHAIRFLMLISFRNRRLAELSSHCSVLNACQSARIQPFRSRKSRSYVSSSVSIFLHCATVHLAYFVLPCQNGLSVYQRFIHPSESSV